MERMVLRPHHILDIVASFGAGESFEPTATGSAVHTVAAVILADTDRPIRLVARADDICRPCSLLENGTRCTNLLRQVDPPRSMQEYNDSLDLKILGYLGLPENGETTVGGYLAQVSAKLSGVADICAHPGESAQEKCEKLKKGLALLRIDAAG